MLRCVNDAIGTSRQFIATHQFGRYQSEADVPESVGGASIDENDPKRTQAGSKSRGARPAVAAGSIVVSVHL